MSQNRALANIKAALHATASPIGMYGPAAQRAALAVIGCTILGALFGQVLAGLLAGLIASVVVYRTSPYRSWSEYVCVQLSNYHARDEERFQQLLLSIKERGVDRDTLEEWYAWEVSLQKPARQRSAQERELLDSRLKQ